MRLFVEKKVPQKTPTDFEVVASEMDSNCDKVQKVVVRLETCLKTSIGYDITDVKHVQTGRVA